MGVHEARGDDGPRGLEDEGAFGSLDGVAYRGDEAVQDEEVGSPSRSSAAVHE